MSNMGNLSELGQLLFTKGKQKGMIVAGIVLIALGCLVGANAFIAEKLTMRIVSALIFLLMATMGVLIIRVGSRVLYLHENGIVLGDTALTFDEIESYCREDMEIGTAGIHTQTNVTLVFNPFEHAMKPKVRFVWQTGRKGDEQVDAFHDRICEVIADRMQLQIETVGRASWSDGITFLPDGLQFTPRKGPARDIRYEDLAEPDVQMRLGGTTEIHLCSHESTEVLGKIRINAENVFPGLLLLESMCERARTQTPGLGGDQA